MKQNSVLKIQSAVLAGMIFTMAGTLHAQNGTAGQNGASIPEQGVPAAKRSLPEQKGTASGQGSSQQKNGNAAPRQGTPAQTGSSSVSLPANQEPGLSESPTPEQESFLHKIIRIFFGPDSPPGPNRDVDTNISAGGAAGG